MFGLIGDRPEAAEAALMAAYPGRDPLAEVMRGDISVRKFRVMVEHLPPGNALEAARGAGWTGQRWVSWHTDARIAQLVALTYNINRGKDKPPMKVEPLPWPKTDEQLEQEAAAAELEAQIEAEMNARFAGR